MVVGLVVVVVVVSFDNALLSHPWGKRWINFPGMLGTLASLENYARFPRSIFYRVLVSWYLHIPRKWSEGVSVIFTKHLRVLGKKLN
jgi:hypothetical protein